MSSKPKLTITYMIRDDKRTYLTDRIEGMCVLLGNRYKITMNTADAYLGHRMKQSAVVEHENGMFKIIDWGDRDNPTKMSGKELIHNPRCQFILKCQYNPKWMVPKLRPFFYFEKTKPKKFSEDLAVLRLITKSESKIFWKGHLHSGREQILESIEDLLNEDFRDQVAYDRYYEELAKHQLAISLPGLGNSCHREFECFGVGTVVISPTFENIYHVPLIPNYHYICVDNIKRDLRNRLQSLSSEEIALIRQHAMDYYDANIRFEASVRWLIHLLEL